MGNTSSTIKSDEIYEAAGRGQMGIIEALLKENNDNASFLVNRESNDGNRPLHAAALGGHTRVIELLVYKDAYMYFTDDSGMCPLHVAAASGHVDAVEKLIDLGAYVHQLSDDKVTAIHYAAGNGHVDVIQALVNKGARVNHRGSKFGYRPLHSAALGSHAGAIKKLVDIGADVDQVNLKGETALHVAVTAGFVDAVQALIEKGANMDQTSDEKVTALHYAASVGHVDVIEALVNGGGRINHSLRESGGYCPLHCAAFGGHAGAIQKLVELGADVHQANVKGETALHVAAIYGFADCIEILLNLRANVNRKDKNGFTALDHATILRKRMETNSDVIELLRDKMSDAFPSGTLDMNHIGFREKVCIGRALAIEYAPCSEFILDKTERPSLRNMYYAKSVADFRESVSTFVTSPTPVFTLLAPPESLAIACHVTFIVLYHHHRTSTSYIWYINPWGFEGDDSWYSSSNKMHPIEVIKNHITYSSYNNTIVIDQHTSMTKVGPQLKSSGFLNDGKKTGVCERIRRDGRGTCVTWGEMYLEHVSQWLKTVEGEPLSNEEFGMRLSKVFGRNIDVTNAFESVSLFAFNRWANKEIVPESLLYAIYTAIDVSDPDKLKRDVMRAEETYESRKNEYAIDKLAQADIATNFLVDSSLHSPDVKSALKNDIGRIEHVFRLERRDRVSDYIVQSTLILVDCKLKSGKWRDGHRRYKRDFSTMEEQ